MTEMPSLTYKFDYKCNHTKIMELIDHAPSIFKHDPLITNFMLARASLIIKLYR